MTIHPKDAIFNLRLDSHQNHSVAIKILDLVTVSNYSIRGTFVRQGDFIKIGSVLII